MIKVVPSSWNFDELPTVAAPLGLRGLDRGWMSKRASAFDGQLDGLRPAPGRSLLHVIALGDYEYYGANRNGDGFLEKGGEIEVPQPKDSRHRIVKVSVGNLQQHPTFVTHGRVYRNHVHDNPSKSYGPILKSAHNDQRKWVELIVDVPVNDFCDELQKIANGEPVAWSMSCKIPYDYCSICGNRSRKKSEYCDHIRNDATSIAKDGSLVCMLNDHMTFFDISAVRRPADRIAYTIKKVAQHGSDPDFLTRQRIGGVALAEQFGISSMPEHSIRPQDREWLRMAEKMAAIEKDVPAELDAVMADGLRRPTLSGFDLARLKSYDRNDVLDRMSRHGILLGPGDFCSLAGAPKCAQALAESVPGMYSRFLAEDALDELVPSAMPGASRLSDETEEFLRKLSRTHGLQALPERLAVGSIRISGGKVKTASCTQNPVCTDEVNRTMAAEYGRYQLCALRGADDHRLRYAVYGNHLQQQV